MQVVRTIIWVLILFGLLIFSFFNWDPVEVTLWNGMVLETKVPALVIIAFLLGILPMWLYHRGVKWRLNRRIQTLENAARSNALAGRHDPAATASAAPSSAAPTTSSASSEGDALTPEDEKPA